MQRVQTQDQAEQVRIALGCFPTRVQALLSGINVFFGDPLFAGLHTYDKVFTYKDGTGDTYTYRDCNHFIEPTHQFHRPGRHQPTVVVARKEFRRWSLAHEYGHALDWLLSEPSQSLAVPPVTQYAGTDPAEAFAEAVAALVTTTDTRLYPTEAWRSWLREQTPEFLAFFQKLAD